MLIKRNKMLKKNQVMLDLETFGTNNNAVIVSISAVKFEITDKGEYVILDTFESGLKIQEQIDKGAIMDADTVMWWLGQTKEAQNKLLSLSRAPVVGTLIELDRWLDGTKGLWGNGATFDNVLLKSLFDRHNVDFNVPFWADRDVRTLVDIKDINRDNFTFEGVPHVGIDDCLHQIKYCFGKPDKG